MEQNKRTPTPQGGVGAEVKDYDDVVVSTTSKDSEKISDGQVFTKNIERISDVYYQVVTDPQGNENFMSRKREELKQDGVVLNSVRKYLGFTVEHARYTSVGEVIYRKDIDGWRNMAQILPHEPKEGDFATIIKLIKHIGGNKESVLLDYIYLLLTKPEHLLPIIVLVSKMQATGKTTFLRFLKALLKGNATILNVKQYSQEFNGLYASKLAIMIDEAVISEEFIKEKVKSDSTQNTIWLRKMQKEHMGIPFYGKFIMATNKETNFAKLEEDDVRFLVLKVGRFEEFDPHFESKLIEEIPHFIHYLLHRPMETPTPLHRMWFAPEQLRTDALDKVLENSRSECCTDILLWVEDKLAHVKGFGVTISELWELLGRKYSRSVISKALREELALDNPNKRYVDHLGNNQQGRAYLFGDTEIKGRDINYPY